MRFVLIYRDIVGFAQQLTFEAESFESALQGLKQRAIENTPWAVDENGVESELIEYKTAWPMALVNESAECFLLEEYEENTFRVRDDEAEFEG